MTTTKAPEALIQRLRAGNRYLLTSHRNPDGDAIGSALGLAPILRSMGKSAAIWNLDETPEIYRALWGSDRIHHGEEPPAKFPDDFDSVIVLECPSLERTGLAEQLGQLPIVNIDHHLGNEQYGEVNWVDTTAPSLGEMIYRLAQALKVDLTDKVATSLFLTLVTDTGDFRFSNATSEAFEAAAALVRDGAQPTLVSQWIHESQPLATIRLLGEMAQSIQLDESGRVASALLSQESFDRAQASSSHAEGLIDHPRSIVGVEAVALVKELGPGQAKVSLRSRGAINVEEIARSRGGGGHPNAAGYSTPGVLEDVRAEIVGRLRDACDRSHGNG